MQYIVPIIALILIFGPRIFKEVKDFLLKKEQIKADALIRAEALRFKNQLDLEKLIHNDQSDGSFQKVDSEISNADTNYDHTNRKRMRY